MKLDKIFELIETGMDNGDFELSDVIEQYKEFIDNLLSHDLGFTEEETVNLTVLSVSLNRAYGAKIRFE